MNILNDEEIRMLLDKSPYKKKNPIKKLRKFFVDCFVLTLVVLIFSLILWMFYGP